MAASRKSNNIGRANSENNNNNTNNDPKKSSSFSYPPNRKSGASLGLEELTPPRPPHRDLSDSFGLGGNKDPFSQERQHMQRLLRVDLVSNIFLCIGGIVFVAFVTRELITCCRRGIVADALYLGGSAGFLANGLTQVLIDAVWTRTIPSGRYTTNQYWNYAISFLFLWGVVLDLWAFLYWREGGADNIGRERTTQWVGSHIWLAAAVIVIVINWKQQRTDTLQDKLDVLGNAFFFMEAVMNVCARYISDIDPEPGDTLDETEVRLELAAAFFWTCNATCYMSGGAIRIHEFRQEIPSSATETPQTSQGVTV